MEDFLLVSVLDVELDEGKVILKKQVQYYVMCGDECVDSLILGPSVA